MNARRKELQTYLLPLRLSSFLPFIIHIQLVLVTPNPAIYIRSNNRLHTRFNYLVFLFRCSVFFCCGGKEKYKTGYETCNIIRNNLKRDEVHFYQKTKVFIFNIVISFHIHSSL